MGLHIVPRIARAPRRATALALAAALLLPLAVRPARADEGDLRATIRRTSYGVPHILARTFAGLGYGYGYAFAQDNLCEIANDYVTVSAQRSRYFGPDAGYTSYANGVTPTNLESDFFYQRINDEHTVEGFLAQAPPGGPLPEVREIVRGYTAGYNKYLADTGVANLPDERCRGAEWVRPITDLDSWRRFYQLMLFASSGALLQYVVAAQPPDSVSLPEATASLNARVLGALKTWDGSGLPSSKNLKIGSNAIGLGKDATDNGRGMLLGNPHFPWVGPERFHEFQLTIPGRFNVEGSSLFGIPLVLIGHTDNVAWSHTVSTAWRFTPYEVKLVPGDPTSYFYDGRIRHMKHVDVSVQVKVGDALETRSHRFWETHYGPMFAGIAATDVNGQPVNIFNWTPAVGYAFRDANTHLRAVNQFFGMDQAQSVRDLKKATDTYQGIPWVNTMSADSSGEAYYGDHSVVPHVTDDQITACVNGPVGLGVMKLASLPVLDGSISACEWGSDADAVAPGIYGPSHLPTLFRSDYVENSNDSYWLSNPHQPLEGYPSIIGPERTARSLRTRIGLIMIEDRLNGRDGEPGDTFTLEQLQATDFRNRQYAGELWRDAAVDLCEGNPYFGDVADACPVLRAWDLHDNIDSAGSVLFRRFTERALSLAPWTTSFDANNPVYTPAGLDTTNPQVWQALHDAITDLKDSGIPLDAKLGDYQYRAVGATHIPIHGGPGELGNFNAISTERGWVSGKGYPNVNYGSSFIQAVQFTDGCPVGKSLLTYSESTNPDSPHFSDQTYLFSAKRWKPMLYCEDEIEADPNLTVTHL